MKVTKLNIVATAMLLLCISLSMGCLEDVEDDTQTYIQKPTEIPTQVPLSDRSVAKYDFEWYTTDYIGKYHQAPPGYTYAVISYKIQNDGYYTIDISPLYWTFTVNGISYDYCSESFDDSINTMSAKISPGSSFTNKIAFIIHDGGTAGRLTYKSPWHSDEIKMFIDNSLISDIEPTPLPIFTPRKPKEITNLTLDDDGFLLWFYSQKAFYKPLHKDDEWNWFDYETAKLESNNSLMQIDEFKLKDKGCTKLRNEFQDYLNYLNCMSEKDYNTLSDSDHYQSSSEQHLDKLWRKCTNTYAMVK